MGMKKRLVILLAGLLTVLSMGFGLAQFSDVPAGHWAKEAVEALAAKGLVIGFPDGTFRGSETLTRYQAALIIYRLLQQIEAELKAKGESPTMKALSEEDLQALRNAVQELASELAALGVRVSALEDNAATKDDIARLEAMIEELKAKPMPEPGMDQAALQDLMDRVEAASIAADTALAQAQQLAEQLEALSQEVEGVKGDVAALQTQVEANAGAIQALNELAVLLNQDVLTLQDRVTALEKGLVELQGVNFEEFATKEDVAAVQEFAAALRSDLVKLADRVGVLESKVADLSKVRYTISGSLSATYGTVVTNGGTNFDLDRLFPKNPFSTGVSGAFTSNVQKADSNQGNISGGGGSLTFGVKVAEPGSKGVNVSEASATLGITLFPGATTPSLSDATVKGNVDGQAFSVVYSSSNSQFKFNDYLFANDNDPEGANPRQGVVATFQGTKFPLSPQVTVVTGTAAAGLDGQPALQPGSYFGIRTALRPFGSFTLALNYATNLLNRSAIGVDGGFGLGPLSLSYLWVSSQVPGSPVANFFNNTQSNWAYYVQGQAKLGAFSLEGNYHAVDPLYADGRAGMSENEDTNYYGGVKSGAPYGANTRGLGFALSTEKLAGLFSLKGYAESEGDYNRAPGSVTDAAGVAITLGSFRGFSLTGFYNRAATGGNSYFSFNNSQDSTPAYLYINENQKYSSSFGATLTHDGKAQDALIPGLNLTLQYANFYVHGYTDFQVYGSLASPLKLAFLSLNPGFRYHLFNDPAGVSASGNYTTVKAGLQASTDPLLFGLSLDGAISYRNTNFSTKNTTTYELYWRIGSTVNDFLASGVKLSGAYAHYEGDNLAGGGLPTVGSGNQAFNFARDRVYRSPDPILGPWTATPGTQSGKVEGFYLQAEYYNLTVAYGEFAIGTLRGFTDYGRGFKFSYNVKF